MLFACKRGKIAAGFPCCSVLPIKKNQLFLWPEENQSLQGEKGFLHNIKYNVSGTTLNDGSTFRGK